MSNASQPQPQIENHQSKILQGLRCPRCGCRALPVYYTRGQGNHIIRIRHCSQCAHRLLTRERLE